MSERLTEKSWGLTGLWRSVNGTNGNETEECGWPSWPVVMKEDPFHFKAHRRTIV